MCYVECPECCAEVDVSDQAWAQAKDSTIDDLMPVIEAAYRADPASVEGTLNRLGYYTLARILRAQLAPVGSELRAPARAPVQAPKGVAQLSRYMRGS